MEGFDLRKPIIAGNWKMHKTLGEAQQFYGKVQGRMPDAAMRRRMEQFIDGL